MRAPSRIALALLPFAASAASWSCAALVGANFTDPALAVGDAGDTTGCALPSAGDARVRLGDFAPSLRRFDFCLAPDADAGASPVDPRPTLAASGSACPAGLGYQEVLAPFSIASGSYRAGAVAVGKSCATTPLASTAFTVAAGETVTLVLVGDPASPELRALPESAVAPAASELRFVHALAGGSALDFDVVTRGDFPVTVVKPVASQVALGAASAPSSQGPVDAHGYLSLPAGPVTFGAAPATGGAGITMTVSPTLVLGGRYSVFASGSSSDVSFPPELFLCDETRTDGLFTACGNGAPLDVTFDTFDTSLSGVFAAGAVLRHDPIVAAISKATADVLCLQEVASDADKVAIIDAARGRFPYSTWFADTLQTIIDDPRDQNGVTPTPPETPSCSGDFVPQVDTLLACLEASCSTAPHDASAHLIDDPAACIYNACGASGVLPIITRPPTGQACWMCVLGELEDYSSFASVRTACTTNGGEWPLAWKGASNTLLLSRFPITSSEQRVLPSALQRATVTRSTLALDNGAEVDAYCAYTTPPPRPGPSALLFPYTGAYGTGTNAWQEELLLQTKQTAGWIAARSTSLGRKSVLLGHLNTGPPVAGVASFNPDSYDLLTTTLPVAAAPGYTPACTLCIENPLVSRLVETSDVWEDLVLLGRMPVTSVVSSSVVYDQPVVADADAGGLIPLSEHYGYRAVVRMHP